MIQAISRMRQRRTDAAFTLIELLVVVIILGIVSGVVVFAVRGIGSKGRDEAIATDLRVIRTAQEAFCAKHGRYADEAELVEKKFLSDFSEHHDVIATTDLPDPRPCNGWRYQTTRGPEAPAGGESATCGEPGGWCVTGEPDITVRPEYPNMSVVELASGDVLAVDIQPTTSSPTALCSPLEKFKCSGYVRRAMLYHPGNGTWSETAPAPAMDDHWAPSFLLLLRGTPEECGDRCGKVLALLDGYDLTMCSQGCRGGLWAVYDPLANQGAGSWEYIDDHDYQDERRLLNLDAVQITGTEEECGANCGKVLIVGQTRGNGNNGRQVRPPPVAELYDPKTNTIENGPSYAEAAAQISSPSLMALPDGRVLAVGRRYWSQPVGLWAKLYNPKDAARPEGSFSDAAPPLMDHIRKLNPLALLPDGTVLAIGQKGGAEIYDPANGTAGRWSPAPSCGGEPGTETAGCYILAVLGDGRILAKGNAAIKSPHSSFPRTHNGSKDAYVFDPNARDDEHPRGKWLPAGFMNHGDTPGHGVVLTGDGCTTKCKVLVTGNNGSTEIYTPS